MVVEVMEAVVGLLNLLSTWRFALCAAAGVVGVYATTIVVGPGTHRLVICAVVILGAFWLGWRWQRAVEQRPRTTETPSGSR